MKTAEIQESFGELILVDSKTGNTIAEGRVLEGHSPRTEAVFLRKIGREMGYKIKRVS